MGIRKFCANRLRGGDEPLKSAPIKTLKQQHKLQPQPKPRPLILIPEYEDYILNSLSFSVLFLLREKYHFQVSIYQKNDFFAATRSCELKREKRVTKCEISRRLKFLLSTKRDEKVCSTSTTTTTRKTNFASLQTFRKCVNYKKCVSPCLQFVHELRLEQKIFN